MTYLIAVLLFSFSSSWAQSKAPVYKKWKTFRSDVGYEFKYPDCWKINIDSPDDEGPLHRARDIFIEATPGCLAKVQLKGLSNGLGFSGGWGPKKTESDREKGIRLSMSFSKNDLTRGWQQVERHLNKGAAIWPMGGDELAEKKLKLGKDIAIGRVGIGSTSLGWGFKVYCPDWWITVTGPSIDYPNVPKSMYAKFKKGDLALPEPYNTIVNSIRCIPAKQKQDPWWVKKNGKWIYKAPSPTKK